MHWAACDVCAVMSGMSQSQVWFRGETRCEVEMEIQHSDVEIYAVIDGVRSSERWG